MPKLKSVARCIWTAVVLLLAARCAIAVDYDKVDRMIRKEPIYKTGAPQYALLLFGPTARRVWLVIDGDTAYIDRNSNGDLTDQKERFDNATDGSRQLFIEISDPDGKSSCVIANLQVHSDPNSPRPTVVSVNVIVFGVVQFKQYCFIDLADAPQRAVPAHFDGPLTIGPATVEGKPDPSLKLLAGNSADLRAIVGTPIADIEFPAKADGQPPVRQRYLLDKCCCGSIFKGEVLTPPEAGPGKAKVTFSFDMWKEGHVAHSTAEIPVITAEQAKRDSESAKSSAESSGAKVDVQ
jgi:hypothetical protein